MRPLTHRHTVDTAPPIVVVATFHYMKRICKRYGGTVDLTKVTYNLQVHTVWLSCISEAVNGRNVQISPGSVEQSTIATI